jgi:protein-S-isoprenylcysteine O-methyltransferase Ste14
MSDRPPICSVFLFHGVAVMAILVVLLPLALYPFTPPFAGKAAGVAFFVAACVERIWSMYLRQGLNRACSGAGRDWTAIAVGYSYALTLGWAAVHFLRHGGFPPAGFAAAGAAVYLAGVALRYWAFHALRHQWHVDVSDAGEARHLVRAGPYGLMRHPLYFGACLEVAGLPMFYGAWDALLFGVLVFVPFEITRAYYEERFLRELFGADYQSYKNEVWAFFPLPFRPGRRR